MKQKDIDKCFLLITLQISLTTTRTKKGKIKRIFDRLSEHYKAFGKNIADMINE